MEAPKTKRKKKQHIPAEFSHLLCRRAVQDFKLRSAVDLQLVVLPYATATPDELERLHKLMYKWTTEAEEILQKLGGALGFVPPSFLIKGACS